MHQGVGAAFKNHADDADGAGDAVKLQAFGQFVCILYLAKRIGQFSQSVQAIHHALGFCF